MVLVNYQEPLFFENSGQASDGRRCTWIMRWYEKTAGPMGGARKEHSKIPMRYPGRD